VVAFRNSREGALLQSHRLIAAISEEREQPLPAPDEHWMKFLLQTMQSPKIDGGRRSQAPHESNPLVHVLKNAQA
jgi:hypothetical protein